MLLVFVFIHFVGGICVMCEVRVLYECWLECCVVVVVPFVVLFVDSISIHCHAVAV